MEVSNAVDTNLSFFTLLNKDKALASRKVKNGTVLFEIPGASTSDVYYLELVQTIGGKSCLDKNNPAIWTKILPTSRLSYSYEVDKNERPLVETLLSKESLVISPYAGDEEIIAAAKFLVLFEKITGKNLPLREYDQRFISAPDSNYIFLGRLNNIPLEVSKFLSKDIPGTTAGIMELIQIPQKDSLHPNRSVEVLVLSGIGDDGLNLLVENFREANGLFFSSKNGIQVNKYPTKFVGNTPNLIGLSDLGLKENTFYFYSEKRIVLKYDTRHFDFIGSEYELKFRLDVKGLNERPLDVEIFHNGSLLDQFSYQNSRTINFSKRFDVDSIRGEIELVFSRAPEEGEDLLTKAVLTIDTKSSGLYQSSRLGNINGSLENFPQLFRSGNTIICYNADFGNGLIKPIATLIKAINTGRELTSIKLPECYNLKGLNVDSLPANSNVILLGNAADQKYSEPYNLPVTYGVNRLKYKREKDTLSFTSREINGFASVVKRGKNAFLFAYSTRPGAGYPLGMIANKLVSQDLPRGMDLIFVVGDELVLNSSAERESGNYISRKFNELWERFGNYFIVAFCLLLCFLIYRLIAKVKKAAREF